MAFDCFNHLLDQILILLRSFGFHYYDVLYVLGFLVLA